MYNAIQLLYWIKKFFKHAKTFIKFHFSWGWRETLMIKTFLSLAEHSYAHINITFDTRSQGWK